MKREAFPRIARVVVFTGCVTGALVGCGGGGGSSSSDNGGNNGGGNGGGTQSFTVTATAGSGGAISASSVSVESGNTTDLTVTPDSGFEIDTVTGCGGSLSGNTYTTAAITADCAVTASFSSISTGGLANIIPSTTAKPSQVISDVQLRVDDNGDGYAVWFQRATLSGLSVGPNDGVYASRLEDGLWQTPQQYTCSSNGLSIRPILETDTTGNAGLVYACNNSTNTPPLDLFADRYVNNLGWTGEQVISSVINVPVSDVGDLAFDANGDALLAYTEGGVNSAADLWFNSFDNGVGWQQEERLQSNNSHEDVDVQVGATSTGNGLAVWLREPLAGAPDLFYSEYVDGTGWQTEQELVAEAGLSFDLSFEMSDNGDAAIAYDKFSGAAGVHANHYIQGSGWQGEMLVTSSISDDHLSIHIEDSGDIVLIGMSLFPNGGFEVWRYDGSSWSLDANVASSANTFGENLHSATDGNGNYIVSWEAQSAQYVATRNPTDGWSFAERPVGQENATVTMNASGTGLLFWQQSLTTDDYLFRSEVITP